MTKSLSIQLQKPHQNQQKVLKEAKRFNLLRCGRRFGKSTLSIYKAAEALCKGESVAYFGPTYKDTSEWWNEIGWRLQPIIVSKDSTLKQIKTVTGGKLDVWSFDNPDSGRGRKYHLVLIDECEKGMNFEKAWKQSIRPTLTDYKGSAWFFSTPQFGRTFFKELYNYQDRLDDWKSWKFTTYDNPYIDPLEVDAAKAELDALTFACEYLAEDVDLSNKPFAYCFDKNRHVKPVKYESGHYLYLSFDFNVDPITCVASQYINGQIRFIREFRLSNSNIYELCDQVRTVFPDAVLMVTGDASGQARSALTVGNINYYSVIREKLRLNSGQLKVPSVNPAISDSQVLTNSILQNHEVYFDPSMTWTIDDLLYVEVNDNGDIDKAKDKHRSHLLDAVRYTFNTFHKNLIRVY
jgi:hypothetical protein